MGDISRNHIIPTAVAYQNKPIENVQGLKDIFGSEYTKYASEQINLIKEISGHIGTIISNVDKMTEERKKANKIDHADKKAEAYCSKVKPFFDEIRYACDKLELPEASLQVSKPTLGICADAMKGSATKGRRCKVRFMVFSEL